MNCSVALQAYATYRFTFDRVYSPDSDQAEVYEHSAKRTVLSTLQVTHAFLIPCPCILNIPAILSLHISGRTSEIANL